MSTIPETAASPRPPAQSLRGLAIATGVLVVLFSPALVALARFALGSELFSYVALIPFVSGVLAWLKRESLPPAGQPRRSLALLPLLAGAGFLAGYLLTRATLDPQDSLPLASLSFVLMFWAACLFFLGWGTVRALAFPLAFLVFLAPMPVSLTETIETFLQHGSARTALVFLQVAGTPVFYHDLIFQLPGFSMEVAPECSGIHSSLVLFITSLLAGHLFLRSPWKRVILALAVVPLALLRNGLRVFVIGELCVHIGPEMINSYIHRHGGPIFFVLSLLPLFLLLYFLVKSDRAGPSRRAPAPIA